MSLWSAALASFQAHEHALARCLGEPLVEGNQLRLLLNGPATFEAMFAAIEQARDHINIESYIIEAAGPGEELARRLIERCQAGVRVNLLFDSVGSLRTSRRFFERLRQAGVHLCEYNPLHRPSALLSRALHLRDHRKLMVIDGRVGFIGGVNVASVYAFGSAPRAGMRRAPLLPAGWRDTHVQVEGPVVAQLQRLFVAHWQRFACGPLQQARYFPPLRTVGTQQVGLAACDAGRGRNPYYSALLAAVGSARQRILLTTAYFVPPRRLRRALMRAAARGVSVQLLLPGISDSWAPLHAGRSHYAKLLHAGVQIFERHDTLLHAKTCVIDGLWASIGSSNTDWRSIVHNAEADLMVLDADFARQLERNFHDDLAQARPIDAQQWSHRSWFDRWRESFACRFEFFL
ncbi:MAG: cardiolipin synthase B [Burkholderiales bacterium]|nr:cardiolipin synthase B [Burkholderiales bacterium]